MTDYPKTRRSSVEIADKATADILALLPFLDAAVALKVGHLVQAATRETACLVVAAVDEARRQRGEVA